LARTISSTYTSGVTLTSTSNNPVSITPTARLSKSAGRYGALYARGGPSNSWTIDNSGQISGGNGAGTNNAGGIYLGSFVSTITNGVVTNEAGGTIAGALYAIFADGPAAVTNKSGGTISADTNTALYMRDVSTITNYGVITDRYSVGVYLRDGGTLINHAGGTLSASAIGVSLDAVGTVINEGVIIGSSTDAVYFAADSASNLLIVDPGAGFDGAIYGGTGKLELAVGNGSAASLGTFGSGGITNFSTLQFDAGSKWTVTGSASSSGLGTVAITGFTVNDAIRLTDFAATSETFANNALVLTNASSGHTTLHIQGAFTTSNFQIAPGGFGGTQITATCYAAGTRILTPGGEVPIEHLHRHDLVLTVSGKPQPIRWIGHRRVDFRTHPNRQRVLPVRITAHAFGPGRPRRDLLLSPDHAVFVEGVLIPIRHLINGGNVTQVERPMITYYHIELPRHDVLLADGMPAESHLEAGARSAFANGDDVIQFHPDFSPPQDHYATLWEQFGYAPLVVAGDVLGRIRELLDNNRYAA
jgi:hypothetical protein